METMTPVRPDERIAVLDVLRGLALFGILLVNMELFHSPAVYADLLKEQLWTHPADVFAAGLVSFLAQGKFYTIFSFLFGFGFYVFMRRAERKTPNPERLFYRRITVLLVFGILHILFLWWGDILTWYALAGFLLPAFYRAKPRTLLVWAFSLLSVLSVLTLLLVLLLSGEGTETSWTDSLYRDLMNASWQAYGEGGYGDSFRQRMTDVGFLLFNSILSTLFFVLPMFLFGMYAAKKGWLSDLNRHAGMIRRIWLVALGIGIVFTGLKEWSDRQIDPNATTVHDFWNTLGMTVGDVSLCFFYIASVLLLFRKAPDGKAWNFLGSAGRMALTLYLTQTVVCTTLFYGYGFGLYGQIGPAVGVLIAVMLYALQLLFSRWWMTRHAYGPMEWLWRRLTYGRRAPLSHHGVKQEG